MNYRPNRIARSLSTRTSKKIGLIYPKKPAFFWDKIKRGFDTAASELEEFRMEFIPIRFESLIGEHEAEILHGLDELQRQDVSAIVVVPYTTPALQRRIGAINRGGIPVLTFSTDVNDRDNRFLYLGPDNYRVGRMAAELIGKFLGGTGELLVLSQPLDTSAYRQRLAGFQDLLSCEYPGITIRTNYRYTGRLQRRDITNLTEIIVSAPVRGIYCLMSDASFWETAEIVHKTGRPGPPIVIGHELNEKIIRLIEQNAITAAICQHPVSQGYRTLKILYDYLFDKREPPQVDVYARIDIVMKENCRNYDRWTELP
jgi:LacI family transcriptional regulator